MKLGDCLAVGNFETICNGDFLGTQVPLFEETHEVFHDYAAIKIFVKLLKDRSALLSREREVRPSTFFGHRLEVGNELGLKDLTALGCVRAHLAKDVLTRNPFAAAIFNECLCDHPDHARHDKLLAALLDKGCCFLYHLLSFFLQVTQHLCDFLRQNAGHNCLLIRLYLAFRLCQIDLRRRLLCCQFRHLLCIKWNLSVHFPLFKELARLVEFLLGLFHDRSKLVHESLGLLLRFVCVCRQALDRL
mmetsp:Transcript_21624/g.42248  ORF Transcript_21624/g.42248 Transcript_21624/m.42248 type:complete len:246 (-) Transcript_21624:727-1464(-)